MTTDTDKKKTTTPHHTTAKQPAKHSNTGKRFPSDEEICRKFLELEQQHGFPEDTLSALHRKETTNSTNHRITSGKGARGFFQFMPATRSEVLKETGFDAWSADIAEAASAAAHYLAKQAKQFDGDMLKALSAYNTGAGNVKKAIRNNAENWLSRLSRETRHFGTEILAAIGFSDQSNVNVSDIKAARRQTAAPAKPESTVSAALSATWQKVTQMFAPDLTPTEQMEPAEPAPPVVPLEPVQIQAMQAILTPAAALRVPLALPQQPFAELLQKQTTPPPAVSPADQNSIEVPVLQSQKPIPVERGPKL